MARCSLAAHRATVLWVPLCTARGLQEAGQDDSWGGRDIKQKRSKKIQQKYNERKKNATVSSVLEEQFQRGKLSRAPLQDQAQVATHTAMCWRPRSWSSIWGKQSPGKLKNPPPSYLSSCKKAVYSKERKKKKRIITPWPSRVLCQEFKSGFTLGNPSTLIITSTN